jgi:hypothetical protein
MLKVALDRSENRVLYKVTSDNQGSLSEVTLDSLGDPCYKVASNR